jgi:hypothetical protein
MVFFALFSEPRQMDAWILAHVAQLVEHILGKDEVTGSSPVMGSISVARPDSTKNAENNS